MAIVLTVAMVSSSKSWFLCACVFVPGANLAPSNEAASATNFPILNREKVPEPGDRSGSCACVFFKPNHRLLLRGLAAQLGQHP